MHIDHLHHIQARIRLLNALSLREWDDTMGPALSFPLAHLWHRCRKPTSIRSGCAARSAGFNRLSPGLQERVVLGELSGLPLPRSLSRRSQPV
ncbi:hypothetical protein L227DRAFT_251954 [Lentinus tigrinus ALCF2SS1-6]|uniref:Uncharacterized protein n=1 Tax=Lentinus tigrinus ALCF2SS1-6 TaxID=1328759 RepID=A0A5C2S0A0_9APHY|nr:hypothetical protein L227DRAFT_251954 [Lentinus tigrinus ALCF2SS1-6]